MIKKSMINKPSRIEVEYYLEKWNSLEDYVQQEKALNKLFLRTQPFNNTIEDVLIKVCALNQFYSTNIKRIYELSNHILKLNIDADLKNNNENLVQKIATGHNIRKNPNAKESRFYSFATKYCSHHKPTVYPIYDSYVDKMLMHFSKKDKFSDFKKQDLKSYPLFKKILQDFREFYNLKSFDLKPIDKYLWQAGKKYFPNNYYKNERKN